MTIKRRLFWSNILMLVIPVALAVSISYLILFTFVGSSSDPIEQSFPRAFEMLMSFQRGRDMEQLQRDVDRFNEQYPEGEVLMAIARDASLIYPENAVQSLEQIQRPLHALLESGATGNMVLNNTRLVVERSGNYTLVIAQRQGMRGPGGPRPLLHHALLLACIAVAVILITNRALTYIIARGIKSSLEVLVDGVHQLRDGNLEYRIQYGKRDEFAPVCEDFNEMACQLERLIQLQQKGESSRKELLAGISHDLRTPLTSIKAYVEGLLDGVAEDLPSQLRYLTIIRQKAEDIDNIVDKLFLFSKLDMDDYPIVPERLSLPDELRAMADAVAEEHPDGSAAVELVDIPDVDLYVDPVQMRSAWANVLENSIKYGDGKRTVLQVRCEQRADTVVLHMADNGPGVPAGDLERIFDVFYRGDPSRQNPSKGSGLGLAITSKILGKMNGSVHAESAPGGGLSIVMEVPRYREEGATS